ncbi:hypothetical protein CRE_08347 [Caenorhabditis remanei]|uniref:Uncharacterized protein n=1 Tax=Caenorhabditis remanei TaxID=31234 RepID=E3MPJ8_CAERE|nr:hypothetical protein CRE_08347 [Caenorhabditis remanei]
MPSATTMFLVTVAIAFLGAIALHVLRRIVGRILHERRQRLEIRRNNNEVQAEDGNAGDENEVINLHQFLLEASDFAQDDIMRAWLARRGDHY